MVAYACLPPIYDNSEHDACFLVINLLGLSYRDHSSDSLAIFKAHKCLSSHQILFETLGVAFAW
jgi:hypothetical protein